MATPPSQTPRWSLPFLAAAGLSHIAWCAVLLLVPAAGWLASGPVAGLLAGITGVGYLLAARDPLRHWPVVLMGLLSEAGGAALTLGAARGRWPTSLIAAVALGDLVWIPGLALILRRAHDVLLDRRRAVAGEVLRIALRRRTQFGVTLDELNRLGPVLLVFLRQAGCTFCREALSDLAVARARIESSGVRLVLVHMDTPERGAQLAARYGLGDVTRIADPERALYRAFGLPRGGLRALFGPRVCWRGFEAGVLGRHGIGRPAGDAFQLPGLFLLYHGEILRSYRHQTAGDRPNYLALATGENYAAPELRA